MRAQFVLSEIGVGLRRNLTMTFAVVVSVALSLALFGGSLLMRDQVSTMKGYWYDKVNVSIFLCNKSDAESDANCAKGAVTQQQKNEIKAELDQMPIVAEGDVRVAGPGVQALQGAVRRHARWPSSLTPGPDAGVVPGQAQGPGEVPGHRDRLRRAARRAVRAGPEGHPRQPLRAAQRHELGGAGR